jgi:hypothetical protein
MEIVNASEIGGGGVMYADVGKGGRILFKAGLLSRISVVVRRLSHQTQIFRRRRNDFRCSCSNVFNSLFYCGIEWKVLSVETYPGLYFILLISRILSSSARVDIVSSFRPQTSSHLAIAFLVSGSRHHIG